MTKFQWQISVHPSDGIPTKPDVKVQMNYSMASQNEGSQGILVGSRHEVDIKQTFYVKTIF